MEEQQAQTDSIWQRAQHRQARSVDSRFSLILEEGADGDGGMSRGPHDPSAG